LLDDPFDFGCTEFRAPLELDIGNGRLCCEFKALRVGDGAGAVDRARWGSGVTEPDAAGTLLDDSSPTRRRLESEGEYVKGLSGDSRMAMRS
jgi:hypothetical protein